METLRTAQVAEVKGKDKPVQASQENLPLTGDVRERLMTLIGESDQVNLFTTAGSCECRRSRGGQEILLGAAPLWDALNGQAPGEPKRLAVGGNDRKKNHILSGAEPFLIRLGISDGQGRVHDKKQPKFRQINRFIQLIDDEFAASARKDLTILDFGCGKSYLTFIMYYYFTVKRGMDVRIIGYDLKADVVEHCNTLAERYGYDKLRFVVADVTKDKLYDEHIDMVVTLHACDTATDYALYYAIQKQADYIFPSPAASTRSTARSKRPGNWTSSCATAL